MFLPFFQAGCLVAGAELYIPGLAERDVAAKATLSAERFILAVEREKTNEAIQDLKIAQTITADKEKELKRLSG